MRTVLNFDRESKKLAHAREDVVDLRGVERLVGNLWLPGQPEQPPTVSFIPAQDVSPSREHLDII